MSYEQVMEDSISGCVDPLSIPNVLETCEDEKQVRHCDFCHTLTVCENIPLLGYSEWLCKKCAAAAYRTGQAN